jgi:hypothetical protein
MPELERFSSRSRPAQLRPQQRVERQTQTMEQRLLSFLPVQQQQQRAERQTQTMEQRLISSLHLPEQLQRQTMEQLPLSSLPLPEQLQRQTMELDHLLSSRALQKRPETRLQLVDQRTRTRQEALQFWQHQSLHRTEILLRTEIRWHQCRRR